MLPSLLVYAVALRLSTFFFASVAAAGVTLAHKKETSPSTYGDWVNDSAARGQIFFEVTRETRKLQESTFEWPSQRIEQRDGTPEMLSVQFEALKQTFNLTVRTEPLGHWHTIGYYRFVNGTVSTSVRSVEIKDDIANLKPRYLAYHILTAIDSIDNQTSPILDKFICGGGANALYYRNLRGVGDPWIAIIDERATGAELPLTLQSAARAATFSNSETLIAASAVSFIAIMNDGISHRLGKQGWVEPVEAYIIEVFLAIAREIAKQAEMVETKECVRPDFAAALMIAPHMRDLKNIVAYYTS